MRNRYLTVCEAIKFSRQTFYPGVWLLIFCVLFTGASHAQTLRTSESGCGEQPSNTPCSGIRTIYLIALNKDGEPILNLKREDFSVLENKQPREIVDASSASSIPLFVGINIDSSGSERQNLLRGKELEVLYHFLPALITASDKAFITIFNDESIRITETINSVSELLRGIQEVAKTRPRGSTALYDSLIKSIETMSSDPARKILIVFGDFQDNVSQYSLEKTAAYVRRARVSVFPLVEYDSYARDRRGQKRGWEAAQRIATESGGLALSFESPDNLGKALDKLLVLLRTSYLLKYKCVVSEPPKTGKPPKIEILGKNSSTLVTNVSPLACR